MLLKRTESIHTTNIIQLIGKTFDRKVLDQEFNGVKHVFLLSDECYIFVVIYILII